MPYNVKAKGISARPFIMPAPLVRCQFFSDRCKKLTVYKKHRY